MQRRATTQDVSWFLDLRRNNQLDLDPPYQRRSVWNAKDRRFFLDTVFRGYPCPPIFLHKTSGNTTTYAVVDGKQRLQTLFLFVDDEIALADDFGDARFNGKRWGQLQDREKQMFWDYVLPVEFLTFDPNDPQEVNQSFDRLNRNMRKLEPQELRHARWDGWLISLVEAECESALWKKFGVGTTARSKRMKDAQFISELLLVVLEGKQHGFDQDHLEEAYGKYDDITEMEEPIDCEDVVARIERTKDYINQMQDANACVKRYAGTLAAFYTLWAAVVLHRDVLPEPAVFAAEFADMRAKTDELKETHDKAPLLTGPDAARYKIADEFLLASGGASTDLKPRERRLEALLSYSKL